MIRRSLLTIAVPIVLIAGYVLFGSVGGALEDAWEDFAAPFLITYCIGLGFTIAWDVVRESASLGGASATVVALTGVLSALVIFGMLGGPQALIDDPWLFGVAIAPGLQLAGPLLRKRRAASDGRDA